MAAWYADVKCIWDNCRKYNGLKSPFTHSAEKLEAAMERYIDEAPPAVAAAARKPHRPSAAQQCADARLLAGKRPAGGSNLKPRAPGEVALLHESIDLAGSDSDGGEDDRQARPVARTVRDVDGP
jgi:hypothetical protein